MNLAKFLKIALKDYRVGAVMPSSKAAVQAIFKYIPHYPKSIIEYGPGEGVLTKELLKILPANAEILAIEVLEDFAGELRKINDARLTVVRGDVLRVTEDLSGRRAGALDLVLSGIPFSFLHKEQREQVVKNTFNLLKDGGVFIVYQTSPLMLPLLRRYFKNVRWRLEPRNLPPYFIMVGEK